MRNATLFLFTVALSQYQLVPVTTLSWNLVLFQTGPMPNLDTPHRGDSPPPYLSSEHRNPFLEMAEYLCATVMLGFSAADFWVTSSFA